ncbi:MAG: DUF1385 domain-containing protein [Clostridia bacterium]|nr:DUF1385 domain-containing protein [Clostridia bacterium]
MAKKEKAPANCRLNRVGGQAVLEGVMMKAGTHTVTTCRRENGTLVVNDDSFVSVRKKFKILDIPILRGVVNFVEMMALSVKTLNASAEAMGIEEEEGKFEKWMKKHLGIGVTDVIMFIGVVLGVALALFLFMFLPTWAAEGVNYLHMTLANATLPINEYLIATIEGVLKICIFLSYLALVSLIPDIKRTFMYHGAEHKSIACFEAGEELTPENAMKHRRFHPRCGTSFMFLMIALGIVAGMFVRNLIPGLSPFAYTGIRLLILPLVMGIGFELLMIMGKHDNIVTRIIAAPGMWVQRLTTKEPTPEMLEVAIVSIKCALRDDFPEFKEYFDARPWEADGGETIIVSEKKKNGANAEKPEDTVQDAIESPDTENPEKPDTGAEANLNIDANGGTDTDNGISPEGGDADTGADSPKPEKEDGKAE